MNDTYAQLLVHLDATRHSGRRLEVARAIAQNPGAQVAALYAVTPALVEMPFVSEGGPGAATLLADVDRDRRAGARALFDRANTAGGEPASWAETGAFPVASAFALQALHADLLVLGQFDATDPAFAGVAPDFVETVLAQSGKPALIVPHSGDTTTVGQTVVIAWKPTREAARAVAAALPLLRGARQVHLVSWAAEDDLVEGAQLTLEGYLRRHGIAATWQREVGTEPDHIGELLLSRSFDLGADLLVMGCYGHSRAREWVLGGASRTVLQSMTLPVLMSH